MFKRKGYQIFTLIILIVIFSFLVGCTRKEVEQPKTFVPTKKVEVKKVSLDEIIQETSITLNTTWTPFTLDDFLSYLDAKKPPVIESKEDEGSPVSVRLIYPSRNSIIDRNISFIASASSDNGNIDSVTFYLDGEKVAELKTPPYRFDFNPDTYAKSEHILKVVAKSGKYKDSDSIKFYNVIKGSFVIYPWKVSSGNIPYNYVNNFYQPDGAAMEAAMFTAYNSNYFYVDYVRRLPSGLNYLMGRVSLDGIIVADQQEETLYARFYNYAINRFDPSYLYEWTLANAPSEGPEKRGESYTFDPLENTGQYAGKLIGSTFPFYGFNPRNKEFRLRIEGKGPTKFFVKPIVVEYYAIKDTKKPTVKYGKVFSTGTTVTCEFYVSEPVITTIYAYDSDGMVRSLSEPKFEGWNEIEISDRSTKNISIKVIDGAGYIRTLPKKYVSR
ncbi:MAG: Ig-like domain-containing protein [Actinobacteria bacterium]|nr:Ig-like domain-containing protein [Actinomycetota bacterium]